MKTLVLVSLLVVLSHCDATCADQPSEPGAAKQAASPSELHRRGKRILQPFNYDGVRLLPSRHQSQFKQVRDYYLRLHPNDVLRGFRLRTKDWAPGKDLGGAYSERPLSFGQWLGGYARMWKATGDEVVRDRALYLMNEWGKTVDEDGFYGYRNLKRGHYDYDKMVGGLVDMHEYLGSEEALGFLDRITTWAEKNLDRSREYALPSEWYTLSENLYRAYELTGDRRYYDFAKVWEYEGFWGALAANKDVFAALSAADRHPSYHAYSHVNSLSSAAMAYSATGEKKYLDTIVNGYNFLNETQFYATGGFGPEESFVLPNGMPETLLGIRRGESNVDVRFHFETSCGSWAGFKLARYLMQFTGDAHYGDWIERLVYNGVGALVPMNDYGMIMYGSSYNIYGAQKSHSTVWFCCQGSLPQTVADYHNLIYFHDEDDLYVNLFMPSTVEWDCPTGAVKVVQETRFPEEPTVDLRIASKQPARFGLKIRVPGWAGQGIAVSVNGKEISVETKPGTWASIEREWQPDDVVTLKFDLSPRAEPLPGYVSPVAVMCGPVVMVKATARQETGEIPTLGPLRIPADYVDVHGKVSVNPAHNLHTNQEFRPFYDLKTGEFYRMYFERSGRTWIAPTELDFTGDWEVRDSGRYSNQPGDSFSAKFAGTAVVWEGLRRSDAGIASVKIDGRTWDGIDQYSYTGVYVPRMDQRVVPFRWSISELAPGEHTLTVTITGNRNPASTGEWINVSGLSAYP